MLLAAVARLAEGLTLQTLLTLKVEVPYMLRRYMEINIIHYGTIDFVLENKTKRRMMIMMMMIQSVQFFIICVPSQQLQGQLQTQHSIDTSNYIMRKHNINSKSN
jgi:hypothetical protein